MEDLKTKRTRLYYWILTGLAAALMLMAAIPDVLILPDAVAFLAQLGYPKYLLPFLGTAKTLGVLVILVPGFPKLKEWAYAGLVFDLVGAFYSHISVGNPIKLSGSTLFALFLVASSYVLYRRKQSLSGTPHETA